MFFFFQAEDGIRDYKVTGVQTCALPISAIEAWPGSQNVPEIWSFGTGARSAAIAARHGTAFGYSLFHDPTSDDTATVNEIGRASCRERVWDTGVGVG